MCELLIKNSSPPEGRQRRKERSVFQPDQVVEVREDGTFGPHAHAGGKFLVVKLPGEPVENWLKYTQQGKTEKTHPITGEKVMVRGKLREHALDRSRLGQAIRTQLDMGNFQFTIRDASLLKKAMKNERTGKFEAE